MRTQYLGNVLGLTVKSFPRDLNNYPILAFFIDDYIVIFVLENAMKSNPKMTLTREVYRYVSIQVGLVKHYGSGGRLSSKSALVDWAVNPLW